MPSGVAVTLADFNIEVARLSGMSRALAGTPEGRRDMIDSLILRELAVQDARKSGFAQRTEFKKKFNNMVKSFTASEYLSEKIDQQATLFHLARQHPADLWLDPCGEFQSADAAPSNAQYCH